jgi:hypothetical protein
MSTPRERQVRSVMRQERWHWLRYRVWAGVSLWIAAAIADALLHARGFLYLAALALVLLWSAKGPR